MAQFEAWFLPEIGRKVVLYQHKSRGPMDMNRIEADPTGTSEQSDCEVRDRLTRTGYVSFPAEIQRGGANAATGGGTIERSISTVVVAELGP